ncbi:MAG: protein serine/threonine phosphatase [Bacteroidota bacterium]|jgi:serine phosphatase RsbU (regulator of sigma subunit)/tetratricopeptide (TPR) repeat protein|nr:protein serine/threonine phosphatase [Bacteroidota bacterium]
MGSVFYKTLFILFFFTNSLLFSENIDSLKQVIKTTPNDTLRIQLLKLVGEEEAIFRIGYWDTIRVACEIGVSKNDPATIRFYQKYLSLAINNIGYVADEQGNIALALDSYRRSAKLCREINDQIGLGKALNNIGSVYEDVGDVASAMDYYHQSLKVREKINDQKGVAVCYNNIGLVYFKQKDFPKALRYYQSGLRILLKLDNKQLSAISYSNIGLIYSQQNNIPLAYHYFEKARSLQTEIGDKFNLLQTNIKIGLIYESEKKYDLALKTYQDNLEMAQSLDFKKGIAVSLSNIANVYFLTGKLKPAIEKGELSLKLFQELGFPEFISSASNLLSRIYERTGNYKGAYQMRVLRQKMNDSINNLESKKASIQKELQYAYEKKVVADSIRIEADKKITDVRFQQEKTQRYALYGGVLILFCVAVFIFNRLQVTKRQNTIIENQKLQVEMQKEEIVHQKELVDEKQKEIIDSINYAKRIQQAVLTGEDVWNKVSKEHFILFKPKDIVSGDFYWAYNTPNSRSVFALADCTGHGVPGGFMSMLGNSFLNEIVVENKIFKADQILNKLRSKIINALEQKGVTQQKDGMDIALCVWNKLDNTLEFSGANNPLWVVRENEIFEYKPDKMPIGLYLETEVPFSSTFIELKKGDVVFLSTDGYADQFGGPKGKKLKYKPLMEMLIRNASLPLAMQKELLEKAFAEWKSKHDQVDDVSIIGIKI